MKNSKEILQAENYHEEVKQKSKTSNNLKKYFLGFMLLISISMMSSCWWGREGRGHEERGHEEHHEEHHEDRH
jgi:hypothetical protein